MKVSIVACGESAREWYKVPVDLSIGVNDCFKFGHEVDYLVLVNSPLKFEPRRANNNGVNRLETIYKSNPKKVFAHNSNWRSYFKYKSEFQTLSMRDYNGRYNKGRVYFSKTSPFVAITLAVSLGAKDIILWGVDMLSHWRFSPGKKEMDSELAMYNDLFGEIKSHGINIWIGNKETVLKDYLQVWGM
jgi:hypothetical protein